MAKIRSLKGEYFRNADISRGGMIAKVLGAGLITAVADDEGRFKADCDYLRGEVFTHDTVSLAEVQQGLDWLESVDFIQMYHAQGVHGRAFGAIKKWKEHQPVPPSRFKESKLPPPPNTKRRKHVPAAPQTERKQSQDIVSSRAGVGSDRKEDRIGVHGDVVVENGEALSLQEAIAAAVVPPDQDVTTVTTWFLDKHGWDTFSSMEIVKRERWLARQMLDHAPLDKLIPSLSVMWDETDPDDRPSSLGFFWTRLQDEAHTAMKAPRSHTRTDGLTKITPSAPARGAK